MAVRSLRRGIHWERVRTWHWQTAAGVERSATIHGAAGFHSTGYLRWIEGKWNRRRLYAYRLAHRSRHLQAASGGPVTVGGSVPQVICSVFGASQCQEALYIAKRESGFSTNPQPPNPTHFGIFQLDSSALHAYATIGYSTAYEQVVAAHNMWLARGWEPWTCCEG